ncbi:Restriction endonuclease, partial [Dysosmobacter welbionis]
GHTAQQKQPQIHHKDRRGAAQCLRGEAAAEALEIRPPAEHRPGRQHKYRQSGDLESAGCGAGGATHQHQQRNQQPGGLAQLGEVQGVVPCGPGGDRLKQRPLDLLPQGQRLPLGQPELIEQEEQRRQQDQCRSHRQHQLALKAVGPQVPLVLPHVSPGEESDAAQDNQPHHGEIHQWVPRIAGQGDEGRARRPHQVEPGVAEGGHRMKHRVPESPEQPHLRAEPQSQQQRPRPLQDQRHRQNEAGPANDAPHLGCGDGLLHHPPLLQPDPPPGQHGDGRRRGHHTHAANL